MIKRKNILKIAIDSPAAAGAGTLGKSDFQSLQSFLFRYWKNL
jgi:cytidylate kinase